MGKPRFLLFTEKFQMLYAILYETTHFVKPVLYSFVRRRAFNSIVAADQSG